MLVRRAEIKDIEKINELLLQVAMVHHYGRPDLFKANCRKYKNDELVEIAKDDNRPIFVAEDDGVVMGYAFCVITDRKDDNVLTDMKNLYIDDLCVDENMRDKHIGTVIYDYVKKYAKEIGSILNLILHKTLDCLVVNLTAYSKRCYQSYAQSFEDVSCHIY